MPPGRIGAAKALELWLGRSPERIVRLMRQPGTRRYSSRNLTGAPNCGRSRSIRSRIPAGTTPKAHHSQ